VEQKRNNILFYFILLLFVSLYSASSQPPIESGKYFHPDTLIELTTLDSTFKLDIRYATSNNFMKRPMYKQARAFLQKSAAEALMRVNSKLRKQGYGLLIFDGYRPWSITKKFWDETPPAKRSFVADPKEGSKHNRGCAVDLSLYKLKTGKEITMPSPYDDFTQKASPNYNGGTRTQRRMRDFLRNAMEAEGFTVNPGEWWHFDYKDWKNYRILDIPFDQIK
jgi:D-alanyl-D-alanine dipeptidase